MIVKEVLGGLAGLRPPSRPVAQAVREETLRGQGENYTREDFDYLDKTEKFATIQIGDYLEETYGLVSPEENDLRNSLLSDWIRATYKDGNGALPGDTIELVEMFDDPNGIETGTIGVVKDVASFEFGGNWEEHVEVDWENGR